MRRVLVMVLAAMAVVGCGGSDGSGSVATQAAACMQRYESTCRNDSPTATTAVLNSDGLCGCCEPGADGGESGNCWLPDSPVPPP